MSQHAHGLIAALKLIANIVAITLVLPSAVTCWIEARITRRAEAVFSFWTQVFALLPGHPGMYLRRAFYWLSLKQCTLNFFIGFGSLIFHRQTQIESGVYIGPYAVVGTAKLKKGCLIGTRANLLSGTEQHQQGADGGWSSSDIGRFRLIEIGEHVWIGEAAIVMADVGEGSVVAAGAVVSAAIPPAVVVAGNPARFVRTTVGAGTDRATSS
jgi:virginiamycin A acetyltransferase